MRKKQEIKRVIDVKNSQAYVKYMDGTSGFIQTQLIPESILVSYYEERSDAPVKHS